MKKPLKRLAGAALIGAVAAGSLLAFAPAANAAGGAQIHGQMTGKLVYPMPNGTFHGMLDTNTTQTGLYRGVNAVIGSSLAEAAAKSPMLTFPAPGSSGRITNPAGQCLYYSGYAMSSPANHIGGQLRWVACASAVETTTASAQWSWHGGLLWAPSVSTVTQVNGSPRTWHPTVLWSGHGENNPWMDAGTTPANAPETGTPPIVTTAPLTATVESKDPATKTAVISGTGEPGATIELSGPWGTATAQVGNDGHWSTPIDGLAIGDNPVNVKQVIDGQPNGEENLTVSLEAQTAPLTARVDSADASTMTAVITGTGEPGASIDLSGPWGTAHTVVGKDGTWSTPIGGLQYGENPVDVTQTIDGKPAGTAKVSVTLEASPIVNPAIAGGAGVAALIAAALVAIRRRKAGV